jgi:hypothetical protein
LTGIEPKGPNPEGPGGGTPAGLAKAI